MPIASFNESRIAKKGGKEGKKKSNFGGKGHVLLSETQRTEVTQKILGKAERQADLQVKDSKTDPALDTTMNARLPDEDVDKSGKRSELGRTDERAVTAEVEYEQCIYRYIPWTSANGKRGGWREMSLEETEEFNRQNKDVVCNCPLHRGQARDQPRGTTMEQLFSRDEDERVRINDELRQKARRKQFGLVKNSEQSTPPSKHTGGNAQGSGDKEGAGAGDLK